MDELISIVVPVYNVAPYIDECMTTLVGQTYQNIEIIIVNDGSTDNSLEICERWAEHDSRVRVYSKSNGGQGPAREYGVGLARGTYISFVDSDDWVDVHFIERLYGAIRSESADIAECEFYRVVVDSGTRALTHSATVMGRPMTVTERFSIGSVCQWKMLFSKEFYTTHQFRQPALPFEDFAVYTLELALAGRVAAVPEPLYIYRKYRPGSTTFRKESYLHLAQTMQYLIDGFRSHGLLVSWRDLLLQHLLFWSSRFLVPCLTKLTRVEYRELEQRVVGMLGRNFARFSVRQAMLLGSYNLTKILQKTTILDNPRHRYNFMSIISLVSAPLELSVKHKNPYRQYMLQQELARSFWVDLATGEAEYLVLDFIEERHDIIERNGVYLTKSDALLASDFDFSGWRTIPRDSAECRRLFAASCQEFVARVTRYIDMDHIVLVGNILAECYGNIHGRNEYDDIADIRAANKNILECYRVLRELLPECQYIDLTDDELYMTDREFEYGCYPWHLNELINAKIADCIKVDA